MKVAITTDWLVAKGGAERVITEMMKLWPEAPLFTTVYKKGCLAPTEPEVKTSGLQKWYKMLGNHRLLLPWMPHAVELWDIRGYDVIVSSSHAVGKGCIPPSNAVHICYCHTPMRYAWEMEEEYLDDFKLWGPMRAYAKHQLKKIREWDMTTAKRVDQFIANSHEVAERIRRHYGRESIVLHPPVDDRFFDSGKRGEEERGKRKVENCPPLSSFHSTLSSFLTVSRLVPYKRTDLAIHVANKLKLPLTIVGEGPEEKHLKQIAGPTITFLGHVSDGDLPSLYANARALLFPVHEDAGIVPLESQACGTPVIALRKGGTLDTVVEDKTGVFFDGQTEESLIDAIRRFEGMEFDEEVIREHAKKFSSSSFRNQLQKIIDGATKNF